VHDLGTLGEIPVIDIFKQGAVVIHQLDRKPTFKEGSIVGGKIEKNRRIQLAQHHTATHIINGTARKILGEHIWQAGAEKTEKKARLDITHYDSLTPEQIQKIENLSNKTIASGINVESLILPKDEAEKRYGFRLYQGGAVPGATLRVVKIDNFDIEACGGTHVKSTDEVKCIKILGTKKIQDGIVRLEFVAGKRTEKKKEDFKNIVDDISKTLGDISHDEIVSECTALFCDWKELRKIAGLVGFAKRMEKTDPEKYAGIVANAKTMYSRYKSEEKKAAKGKAEGDEQIIVSLMQLFRVQREHLVKTVKRFRKESDEFRKLIDNVIG